VTSVLFSQLLNTVGHSEHTRDKAAEHEAEKHRVTKVESTYAWQDATKTLSWRLEAVGVDPSAINFGSIINSNYLNAPRPYWQGAMPTLSNVNWGRHDLECGQPCSRGRVTVKNASRYAADVGALASEVIATHQPLVFRTLIPSFHEMLCGKQSWRWRGVDFQLGTATNAKPQMVRQHAS